MYAGDWAQKGVRISLVKTGNNNACSRYVTLEMVDEERFHSNPFANELAIIVNVSCLDSQRVEANEAFGNTSHTIPGPCFSKQSRAAYISKH